MTPRATKKEVKRVRQWLKDTREKKNLSQLDVAMKSGIARTTYAMIEQGKRNPSPAKAKRIASVLKTRWTFFYDLPSANSVP
jgi:putative transcriptional regulator